MISTKASQSINRREMLEKALKSQLVDSGEHMRGLVNHKGYFYAKEVARKIKKEFECRPGSDGWETYSTIAWALDSLFNRIENQVLNAPKEDKADGSNKRKRSK